ncbi:hypothetical protein FSP39_014484 [Pinctada imbricata]|uniref:Chromo domain-containing protein n=1 Tax=Pinctada imbricata TaxID=66713 RepID=A0AA89C5V5_PINIB|nr:hypothetical protein FSP39_014484 [Pinctada imbricata]
MLYRFFTRKRTYRYINHLQEFVNTYNKTGHRSLGYMSPSQINKKNEGKLWSFLYLQKSKSRSKAMKYKFKIGDFVRISHAKKPFMRAYDEQFTPEIFKIRYRYRIQGFPLYKLIDFLDQSVKGSFYQYELLRVYKDSNSLWLIEKVLKKRRRHGKTEMFVKFLGWDKRFNAWVPAKEIRNLN